MMNIDYLKIIATVVLAVIGWLVGHYYTSKRDRRSKRRDITLEYQIKAYLILANEISHRDGQLERNRKLENIICEIQLFGSSKQVGLAKKLAEQVASGGTFHLDPIINDLRNDLRNQLNLGQVDGNVKWLRFQENQTIKSN